MGEYSAALDSIRAVAVITRRSSGSLTTKYKGSNQNAMINADGKGEVS
jgi:hypothetical protein